MVGDIGDVVVNTHHGSEMLGSQHGSRSAQQQQYRPGEVIYTYIYIQQ